MFSTEILFLIASAFLLYTSQAKHIRGKPEVDYPTYYAIPKTSFRCSDQLYIPGFYADTETRCQVFHYCYKHRQESFLCPMGTIFNQPVLACDYWYSSNCSLAPSYYHANAEKGNDHFDEADYPLDSNSENLFDKMAHLYETNKAPEPSVLKNESDTPENKFLGGEDVKSYDKPLIEDNKKDNYNKYIYNNQFNMVDEEQPEVVKYEVSGLNTHTSSENEELYETEVDDFFFAEDGMLHPSQEDIYRMYPTDMNFNQEYSGYAEIPSEGSFNYDLNGEFNPESDTSLLDFQRRFADMNDNYVKRRPSSRKPVIIIPEAEPEIVPLPIVKHKRRPILKSSTESTNEDLTSHETNYDSTTYKEGTVSIANEVIESTTPGEFPLDESNSDLNDYELKDPKLFYKIQGENGLLLNQTDSLNAIDSYLNKKTRNTYVLSNANEEEISYNVFGSGNGDLHNISDNKHQRTFIDSNYGDEAEVFIGNAEVSTILPDASSETASEVESSFDSDPFLGSGSEENINHSHSNDGLSFLKDEDIFSDSENGETTDTEPSYVLPMDLSNNFERSEITDQETFNVTNFNKEVNESQQFVLKEDIEDNIRYGKESSFSSKTFESFLPLETLEDSEDIKILPEGSGRSDEFVYLPHELQESSENPQDVSDKMIPEAREIDGSYYDFSDSEGSGGSDELIYLPHELQESSENPQFASDKMVPEVRDIDGSYYIFSDTKHSNYESDDSTGFDSENEIYAVTENFGGFIAATTEELIDNEGSRYALMDSKLKMDNIENSLPEDYEDYGYLENTYEKLSDEFEEETLSDISEETIVDDSESNRLLSSEDLKVLEMMSQNPSPMLQNLFEVSNEKSNSDVKEKNPPIEIISPALDIDEQAAIHENLARMESVYEFESTPSGISSDTEEHLTNIESSENNSKVFNAKQIAEEALDSNGSGQGGSEVFSPEHNLEAFLSAKEADPFSPLFAEHGKILLDGPGSKQKLSLKVPLVKPKNTLDSSVIKEDLKKVARGKRFDENLRIFNPLLVPNKETLRKAIFANIPSTLLKMKHSTLRPYFYNYGLHNSGFNPRTGDLLQSPKLSKLTSWGKRLLAAKRAKFNIMKKYIDSYRN